MKAPSEKHAVSEIIDALAELLGTSSRAVQLRTAKPREGFDFYITALGYRFLVEYRQVATPGPVASAISLLKRAAERNPDSIALLVVPFLSPRGRELCDQAGVSWFDFCGNGKLFAAGVRIWVEGRGNKFIQPGRPSSPFAPKSARVARQLLAEPHRFQKQTEIARKTKLGDGFVSKIVARLVAEDYLITNDARAVQPRDPDLLLNGWLDHYDFDRNRILVGRVPAGRGDEVLHRNVAQLSRERIEYAVTGLSGAWLWTKFAPFELTTIYVRSMPSRALLKKIDFAEQRENANIWFVAPSDDGVFEGSQQRDDVQCASPLQVYLDLKGHPEQAAEVAVELRKRFLTWGQRGK